MNHVIGNAKSRSPLRHIKGFPIEGQIMIIATVIGLGFVGSPLAISGPVIRHTLSAMAAGIVAVVVNSINGMLGRRAWPHVVTESYKRIAPSCAYLNSSFTISLVRRQVRVFAPLNHRRPNAVNASSTLAVRSIQSTAFIVEASTTLRVSCLQVAANGNSQSAAVATAQPFRTFSLCANKPQHRQAPKSLVGQILEVVNEREWLKGNGILCSRHWLLSRRNQCLGLMSRFYGFSTRLHYNTLLREVMK